MTETASTTRVEPIIDPGPVSGTSASSASSPRAEGDLALGEQLVVRPGAPGRETGPSEHIVRIEEKTARIEDKLSRFESNNQRVVDRLELASARMSEVAQQADLATVKAEVAFIARRVRNLPGLTALAFTAIVTALLTAVLTAVVIRYLPGVMPR